MPAIQITKSAFAKMDQASLVKSFLKNMNKNVEAAPVWGQCADDLGAFTFDEASTTYAPAEIVKGIHADLNLAGIVSEPITVENLAFHADWNGSPIYDVNFVDGSTYDSTYAFTVGWEIPSYTPSGDYAMTFTGKGSGADVLCITAAFTFA